jgi:hypothetical protein
MNQKDIWKKYITAQSKILEHKSKPIGIDTSKEIQLDGLKLHLSIDQEIFKQIFKKEVEQIFNVKDFDFNSGYIQTSIENTVNIANEILTKLKDLAEICYIEFNGNPVVEGVILAKNSDIKVELENVFGKLPLSFRIDDKGFIHLTIDEWRKCQLFRNLKIDNKVSARFDIKPSVKFISEIIYQNQIFLPEIDNLATSEELPSVVFEYLSFHLSLKIKSVKISIVADCVNSNNLIQEIKTAFREKTSFYTHISENELSIILEDKKIRKIGFVSFKSAIENINDFVNKDFGNSNLKISTIFFYKYNKESYDSFLYKFLENNRIDFEIKLKSLIENNSFRIDQSLDAIYFDFESEEELTEKKNFIKSIQFFDIHDRGENHRYKFNIKFETGLQGIQSILKKEFPNLITKLVANGEKLIFRQFYQTGNKTEILARLKNQLDDSIDSEYFNYKINDTFEEKYLCEEKRLFQT